MKLLLIMLAGNSIHPSSASFFNQGEETSAEQTKSHPQHWDEMTLSKQKGSGSRSSRPTPADAGASTLARPPHGAGSQGQEPLAPETFPLARDAEPASAAPLLTSPSPSGFYGCINHTNHICLAGRSPPRHSPAAPRRSCPSKQPVAPPAPPASPNGNWSHGRME